MKAFIAAAFVLTVIALPVAAQSSTEQGAVAAVAPTEAAAPAAPTTRHVVANRFRHRVARAVTPVLVPPPDSRIDRVAETFIVGIGY